MSKLNVDNIENRLGTGGPQLPGATFTDNIVGTAASFTGIVTATSFTGNVTGDATGLTGNPSISVTDITATGNVSIAGTLTYEDVTNVDSIGIITAQSGIDVTGGDINVGTATTITDGGLNVTGVINVGTATTITDGGINVVGVVTATSFSGSFSGDGSQLQGVESGVRDFVASGSISNGDTVIINADGTVSVVVSTPSAGTPAVFESASTTYISATYDSTNQKVVIAYRDVGNSNYGTAIVGTVSGTSISFGTPVVFETGGTLWISATYDSINQKVVIAYQDNINFSYGTAIVGTVSGTSISFGTPTVFESATTSHISATFDSSNSKVVIAYRDEGSSNYGRAVVGTVSGTSISFGTPVLFESADTTYISSTFDFNSNKVVIAYRDNGNSNYGTAVVGTVSGTSISFGTPTIFESAQSDYISATFDSNSNKVVIAYTDGGNSFYGTAIVGTVSGTSISFGTPAVFESANLGWISATFDFNSNKVVIAYQNTGNSLYGTAVVGTVSGTSISFGTSVVFESANTFYISATYDSANQKVVIAYEDGGNLSYGTASVITPITTNLTDENYIGIAAEAISDTATGKITIAGGTNTSQTGLTTARTHYVQNDGSGISTISSNPSVVAGTSISSTEIIVKG